MLQAAMAAQVIGRVDDGLDPQRPPVLQVLLDPGVLEERVDGDVGVPGDQTGPGCAAQLDRSPPSPMRRALEDQFDGVRAADVQVVDYQRLEERPGPAGCVEDQGAGHLDLPHRQLPPVVVGAVVLGQRQR